MVLYLSQIGELSSNFLTKLQARKELNRIEDRYVRRTNRNTWRSDAQYIDGEYVYTSHAQPSPTAHRSRASKAQASEQNGATIDQPSSSSRRRPATDSSAASDTSKNSGASTASKLAKRFSTAFPW